jgi:hypothetical protein
MSNPQKLDLPQAVPTVRPNGDVVLEVTHYGQVVGGLNITQVLTNWFARLGWLQPTPAQPLAKLEDRAPV